MLKHRTEYDGHVTEIRCSLLTGKETVLYDGRVVSQTWNFFSFNLAHRFQIEEEGYELQYKFAIPRYRYRLLKEGNEVASGTVRGWIPVLIVMGLLGLVASCVAVYYADLLLWLSLRTGQ